LTARRSWRSDPSSCPRPIDRVDARRAGREQRLREPAGGRTDVESDASADARVESVQGRCELSLATEHAGAGDDDRCIAAHEGPSVSNREAVDEHAAVADQALRLRELRIPSLQLRNQGLTHLTGHGGEYRGVSDRTLVLDFDGTVTQTDLLDTIAREFGDPAVYQQVEEGLHAGTVSLRECITREFEPVTTPLEEVVEWVLANARVRAGFRELVDAAHARGWRVVVLSSGFEELIVPVLEHVGVDVEVVANRVDALPDGWRVHWRETTACTVCGEECKRAALPGNGEIVYVGDGISDRCAALASDRVFATRGLARYLDEQGVQYERFDDFFDVLERL
jgi:2,3-diketo-5-methylthio-1-phosphopentane phosphatase